jgi:hypothetical protein
MRISLTGEVTKLTPPATGISKAETVFLHSLAKMSFMKRALRLFQGEPIY